MKKSIYIFSVNVKTKFTNRFAVKSLARGQQAKEPLNNGLTVDQ